MTLPQQDYRAVPNLGQEAAPLHGMNARDEPAGAGAAVAPQPAGARGYSLNSLAAPPNLLVPGPAGAGQAPQSTPNPTPIGDWDR